VRDPHLLFTAHSIPLYTVKKGDTYPETIKTMAANLARMLNMPYSVAFQSRVGPVKWVGPDTDEHLEELISKGERNIIIIPISFSTECLETVFDLEINLTDNYINDTRVNHLSRVVIPPAHPLFIETLKLMVNA
jgi:protoporphyrin/coproporphyrin ferrochelatase